MTETSAGQEIDYEAEAEKARHLLRTQGCCLLKCKALGGDTIALLRDHPPLLKDERERIMRRIEAIKKVSAVYTEAELTILCSSPDPKLLHQVKREGAELTQLK